MLNITVLALNILLVQCSLDSVLFMTLYDSVYELILFSKSKLYIVIDSCTKDSIQLDQCSLTYS